MAATLNYLASEVLELAGEITAEKKKKTIMPHHIAQAMRADEEIVKMMADVQMHKGGHGSNIHPFLLPAKKGKGRAAEDGPTQQM